MVIGVTFIVVAVLVVAVWLVIEVKRMKHKLFAIFLIGLILFTYISFSTVMKNNDVDMKTTSGLAKAGKLYLSWLGTLFGNMKSITTYALRQDWKKVNVSVETDSEKDIWDKLKG